jgi:cytochrome d ubiquinol oxidase subunit I
MEGLWETGGNVPLLLFAIPDQAAQTNHFEIGIPNLASLILTHSADGVVPGMNEVPLAEQPPVGIIFWSFRIMVGIGLLMIAFAVVGLALRPGGRFATNTWFLKGLTAMSFTPFIAVLAGWFVTEVGRYPWLLWGEISLAQGLTPSLTGGMALFTLIGYVLVYALVFYAGVYYLMRIFSVGLEGLDAEESDTAKNAKRPWSAADVSLESGAA